MIKIRKAFIKILIAIILYSLCLTAEAEQASSNVQNNKYSLSKLFKKAKRAGREYKTQLEMQYYEEFIKKNPKDIKTLEMYAQYLKDHMYYDKSIIIYQKLYTLTKDEKYRFETKEIQKYRIYHIKERGFAAYIGKAKELESLGQIKQANEFYQKALKISPERFEAKFGLAKTYGWLGQKKLAAKFYKDLLNSEPDNKDLLAAYNQFTQEILGLKKYQPEIKPSGKSEIIPGNKQQLKTSKQMPPLETISPSKTVSAPKIITPDYYSEYMKKAQALETAGQIEKANEVYQKAQQLDASRYEARFGLARTYGWLHKDDLAMKYYQGLLKETPNNTALLGFWAEFLVSVKKYSEAMEIYQKLLAQTNDDKYNANIADIYFLQQDYETALKLYSELYNKNPNDADIQKSIARIHFVSGDFIKSIEFYEKYFAHKAILNLS